MIHAPLEQALVIALDGRGPRLGNREFYEDIARKAAIEAASPDKKERIYSSRAKLGTFWFIRELENPQLRFFYAIVNEKPIEVKETASVVDKVIRDGSYYGEMLSVDFKASSGLPVPLFRVSLYPDSKCKVTDDRADGLLALFEVSTSLGIKDERSSKIHDRVRGSGRQFDDVVSRAIARFNRKTVDPQEVAGYVVRSFKDYL